MGTKLRFENYLPGYHSMREFNQDSGKINWMPPSYCEKPLSNGLYFEHLPPGSDKDVVKETMLEHDAVFKGQVSELHRLYSVQKDMMDGDRTTEVHRHLMHMGTSSTASPMARQIPSNDAWEFHKPNFKSADSVFPSPSVSGYSKGNNNTHTTAAQDRFSSKVGETYDSRPSKVRKRLFDLRLPAEDYVDTEEEETSLDHKMSDHSRYSTGRYDNVSFGLNMKSNLAGGVKTRSYENGSRSASYLRDSFSLPDADKTIQIDEANQHRSVNFMDIHGMDSTAKPKSKVLLGLSEQNVQSAHERSYMTSSNIDVQNDHLDRGWLSYMNDQGYAKPHYSSSQVLQLDKSHISSLTSGNHPSDCNRRDQCIDRTNRDLEFSERNHHQSISKYQKPVAASSVFNPYLFSYPREDSKINWLHAASPLEQPRKSSTKYTTSSQVSSMSLLCTSSKTIQPCGPICDTSKDHGYDLSNSRIGCVRPTYNSFLDCSASGSKDMAICFPSTGSGSVNGSKEDKVSEFSTKCSPGGYLKAPYASSDIKPAIDMNLKYWADVEVVEKERNNEECSEGGLPWLKRKSNSQNKGIGTRSNFNSLESNFPQAASDRLCHKNETVKDPIQHFSQSSTPASHGGKVGAKGCKVDNGWANNRKIFGFPMFDQPSTSNIESSCLLIGPRAPLPSPQGEVLKNYQGEGVIDLNVDLDPMSDEQSAAEDLLLTEKVTDDIRVSKSRNFDLNSCVTDDEATLEPSSSGVYIDNSIVACDPKSVVRSTEEVVVTEGRSADKRVVNFRSHIDLNSCVTEEEVTLEPSCSSAYVNTKTRFVIDLEVPAAPETDEDTAAPMEEQVVQDTATESLSLYKVPKFHDESIKTAAEAIIAISSCKWVEEEKFVSKISSVADPSADSLVWFADVISSYWDNCSGDFRDSDGGINMMVLEESSCDEIDDFEVMALKLTEMEEEDYMPKPLFPQSLKVEETRSTTVSLLPQQTRRGRGRRGRQRKDFQRDILPSLVSLSRHEVTRDLQTFGGMMQATGQSWNVDSTRRSRGRPRRSDVLSP